MLGGNICLNAYHSNSLHSVSVLWQNWLPMLNYKAVIFDLDGTLIDSLADIATAVNRVLKTEAFPQQPLEAFRTLVGDGVLTLFKRAVPRESRDNEAILQRCVAQFKSEYEQCWHEQSHLYDGIAELLDNLNARNLPLGILSNKPHAFTVKCAEHFLAPWPFAMVLGQREGIAHKPHPAGALEIASAFHLEPAQCLYVGDSSVDMQTGVAAGMFPLGVAWGFRTREELEAHGAGLVIDHAREFPLA